MQTKPFLTLEDVKKIAAAAEAEAKANNWGVAIAIVDEGGHLLWFQRPDGVAPISSQIAPAKARAAALGRRESKIYEDVINNGRYSFLSAGRHCVSRRRRAGHRRRSLSRRGRRVGREIERRCANRQGRHRRAGAVNPRRSRPRREYCAGRRRSGRRPAPANGAIRSPAIRRLPEPAFCAIIGRFS
jgi:hypothetical protein